MYVKYKYLDRYICIYIYAQLCCVILIQAHIACFLIVQAMSLTMSWAFMGIISSSLFASSIQSLDSAANACGASLAGWKFAVVR